jgi:hypothetical protein
LFPTLRTLRLSVAGPGQGDVATSGDELAAGLVSRHGGIESLTLPWEIFAAFPVTCPAFPRLTELKLAAGRGGVSLTSPVWDLVGRRLLPALATLEVSAVIPVLGEGAGEGEGGTFRFARALAAVAGTLRRLTTRRACDLPGELTQEACQELGEAIGKVRRLRSLWLDLCEHGRGYHATGRGTASSGECPQLFQFRVEHTHHQLDLLTLESHLVSPSVRDLSTVASGSEEEVWLFCCGLVRRGYRCLITSLLLPAVDLGRVEVVQEFIRTLLRDIGGMNVATLGVFAHILPDPTVQ